VCDSDAETNFLEFDLKVMLKIHFDKRNIKLIRKADIKSINRYKINKQIAAILRVKKNLPFES